MSGVDPCDSITCPVGAICRLDAKRNPLCQCGLEECDTVDSKPVCSNDGRTYSSICLMRQQACLRNHQLQVLFDDICAAGLLFIQFQKPKISTYTVRIINRIFTEYLNNRLFSEMVYL